MGPKWHTSDDFDFRLALEDGGALTRCSSGLLPDGAYWFEDRLELTGTLAPPIVTCTAWLLELYSLDEGEIAFHSGEASLRPDAAEFGVFYPPFAMARPELREPKGRMVGMAATAAVPADLPSSPVLFETTFSGRPGSAGEAFDIVRQGRRCQGIDAYPAAAALSRAAKKLIDENYQVSPGIGRVAARLGVAHAHLTRQFKRDFGLSPSSYLHQLRMADAPLRLARGEPIIDVSEAVGYNDLSRFYKQFNKRALTTPGNCQSMVQPADA
jgi:AraC-like DNA-binding protein